MLQSLIRTIGNADADADAEAKIDDFPVNDDQRMEEAHVETQQIKNQQNLFKGLRFFLNREVPREPLVFMIRSFGGEISWDPSVACGSTFEETDKRITHQVSTVILQLLKYRCFVPCWRGCFSCPFCFQVCDRPKELMNMSHIDRYYIQPQWVFDSINRRTLLPVHDYFLGEILPPHLSPFIADRRVGDYIPPEERKLLGMVVNEDAEESRAVAPQPDSSEEDNEEEVSQPVMSVSRGKTEVVDEEESKKNLEKEELRLRKMMIRKKHKGLFRSMMKSQKRRVHEAKQLTRKRKLHDQAKLEEKKN